jgi:hypothetical protein
MSARPAVALRHLHVADFLVRAVLVDELDGFVLSAAARRPKSSLLS